MGKSEESKHITLQKWLKWSCSPTYLSSLSNLQTLFFADRNRQEVVGHCRSSLAIFIARASTTSCNGSGKSQNSDNGRIKFCNRGKNEYTLQHYANIFERCINASWAKEIQYNFQIPPLEWDQHVLKPLWYSCTCRIILKGINPKIKSSYYWRELLGKPFV